MNNRLSITLVLVLLIGSVLTACGGGAPAPVTFGQLPVFTGATESTNEVLTGALARGLEASKADSTIAKADGKAYDWPTGATGDAISSFYKTELEKAGWTVAQSGNPQILSRGKQGLTIIQIDGIGIIVILYEMK